MYSSKYNAVAHAMQRKTQQQQLLQRRGESKQQGMQQCTVIMLQYGAEHMLFTHPGTLSL
jgi:hypothetical protein